MVDLQLGEVALADLRLLATAGLEREESVLTGGAAARRENPAPVPAGTPPAELSRCALMGTLVHAGSGTGVVPTTAIFVINVVLHQPVIGALLFSHAIAVGISPQLLPAVVSTSLAAGSRQLARRKVLVKRLMCIEDLGDIDVLFTDRTDTLPFGHDRRAVSVLVEDAAGNRVVTVATRDAGPGKAAISAADEQDMRFTGLPVFLDPPKATARQALGGRLAGLGVLPMPPSQILLNNLLYVSSQMAIPTDNVDPEQVAQPSRWDVGLIRWFMLYFGPISSLFGFATFGVMLWAFHGGLALFRSPPWAASRCWACSTSPSP